MDFFLSGLLSFNSVDVLCVVVWHYRSHHIRPVDSICYISMWQSLGKAVL